jgi:hypothetical protein
LSDNAVVDLSGPTPSGFGYDVVSVLVPDGAHLDRQGAFCASCAGNEPNDYLGVDGTEAWLLDSSFRMAAADLAQSGVGAAAKIPHVELILGGDGGPVQWALVRPWVAPPFPIQLGGQTIPVGGTKSPHVGQGRMRVLLNEPYFEADTDQDGLSDTLEALFGTCDGNVTWTTSTTADGVAFSLPCATRTFFQHHPSQAEMDPRDTDGDGISDGAEVLGSDVSDGWPMQADGACQTGSQPTQQTDVDQTFPLWGFSPTREDALVEIDYVTGNQCATPTDGCRADKALYPVSQSCNEGDSGCLQDLYGGEYALWVWHEMYAHLDAQRTLIPGGINVHFDARLMPVTTHHGQVPEFTLHDLSGDVVGDPGSVIFVPNGGSGGQCSCQSGLVCPDPRHGGYAHYAQLSSSTGGGGTSDLCGGTMYAAREPGQSIAHEMGHHLGLQHGGPDSCGGVNPNGLNPAQVLDVGDQQKIAHFSVMSYSYTYPSTDPVTGRADISFSLGEHRMDPLPRSVGGTQLVYPETDFWLGVSEPRIGEYEGRCYTPEPASCQQTGACFDADFNSDGNATEDLTVPVESGTGGAYTQGTFLFPGVEADQYWCSTEQRTNVGACCNMPLASDGTCPGTMDEGTVVHSMMGAASPTATIVNGRLYGFLVDDTVDNDDVPAGVAPPRRCNAGDSTCTFAATIPSGTNVGKLRWVALDGFDDSHEAVAPRCLGSRSTCPVEHASGTTREVTVDGERVDDIVGTTLLSSATVVSGSQESVFLGWTTRGSYDPTTQSTTQGFTCSSCATQWRGLRLAVADGGSLETTGFRTVALPPAFGANVDGIAMAAWDPSSGGAPSRLFLAARDAVQHQVYWVGCDADGTCDASGWHALTDPSGATVTSATQLSVAVEHGIDPSAANPALWLFFGAPSTGGVATLQGLRAASSAAPSPGTEILLPIQLSNSCPGTQPLQVALDSSVSAAFTGAPSAGAPPDNHLVLSYELYSPPTQLQSLAATYGPAYQPGSSTVTVAFDDHGPWSYSTVPFSVDSGTHQLIWSADPGLVANLFYDDRAGVATPNTPYLARRVRGLANALEESAFMLEFYSTADGATNLQHNDYDDQATLAFMVCPTVASDGHGVRGADLASSVLGPLRCPGALHASGDSGFILNRLPIACESLSCFIPDPQDIAAVVSLLSDPAFVASPIAATLGPETFRQPLPSSVHLCANDHLSAAYRSPVAAGKAPPAATPP